MQWIADGALRVAATLSRRKSANDCASEFLKLLKKRTR
jgi:hypothetical protein